MGNTPSTTPDGKPIPTTTEMRQAEDACGECEHQCDVLQYPKGIEFRIHRNYVLHQSGKLYRWHILIHSGVDANKWPRDIGKSEGFTQDVINATKTFGDVKFGVSLIPAGPESNCNPEEATDITIFPEFIRYHNVQRDQITSLLKYHTEIIGPRHQAAAYHKSNPDQHPQPQPITLTTEQQNELDEYLIKNQQNNDPTHTPSEYMNSYDHIEHQVGISFPIPMQIKQHTLILLCGHTIRDKRCGVTAPILRAQIEDVMETKHKDEVDNVDVHLVSHVGGHKVAGNVIIFSKQYGNIFYGRVFPFHIENIIDKTIFKGEILEPITRACHNELW